MNLSGMDPAAEPLAAFLLDNPWCPAGLLGRILGLGRRRLAGLADQVVFERLQAPQSGGRGYQTLYALTAEGARQLGAGYRAPRLLAEALLLSYGRLGRARTGLAGWAEAASIRWTISPWRPTRRAPYFDALLCLNRAPGRAALAALACPPEPVKLDWYQDLLAAWTRWRRKPDLPPAALVIWDPPHGPLAPEVLARPLPDDPLSPVYVCLHENLADRAAWRHLGAKYAAPLTAPLPECAADAVAVERFRFDLRLAPYPRAVTLRYWAGRDRSQAARSAGAFLNAEQAQIELLLLLARFPALLPSDLGLLTGTRLGKKVIRPRLAALAAAGLAQKSSPGRWLPAEAGLALLAGMAGVSLKAYNRSLGWPLRPGAFQSLEAHQDTVTGLMLRLLREGVLSHWSFNAARYTFVMPKPLPGRGLREIRVYPDSAGVLDLDGRSALFWLEVDRGTRNGERLSWKLEKYFLIHFALLAPTPVPPILYLVSGPEGREERRLEAVARLLLRLAHARPGTELRLLLTTTTRLAAAGGPLVDAPVWIGFAQDRLAEKLVSLRAGNTEGRWSR